MPDRPRTPPTGPAATRTSRTRRAPAPSPYVGRPWLSAYAAGVPHDVEVPNEPLGWLLDQAAAAFPTAIAVSYFGASMTYARLRATVETFASALAGLGVRPGDRVALVLPNCPQYVVAFFATMRLGAVVVPHNPLYTATELRHQLRDCGATAVICLDRTYPAVAAVRADTGVREIVVADLAEHLPLTQRALLHLPLSRARAQRAALVAPVSPAPGVHRYSSLLRRAPTPFGPVAVDPGRDLAVIQYTGGTTGVSRGARLTHANLLANAVQTRAWLPDATAGREVTLAVLPLFHSYGLTMCLTTTVLLAGRIVLVPRFDLDLLFATIDAQRPTLLPGVLPIYRAMLDAPALRRHDLRSIRACISGAMRLPLETQEAFERATGGFLVEGYGMTETAPATHCNPIGGTRKRGSIGVPLPGTHAKIVDPERTEAELPVGAVGELAVCGPQVFPGYWGEPPNERVFTDDGYLLTGDLGLMDDDGFFSLLDRRKDLIVMGGFNVYPSEIEAVLEALPGVADSCVVGLPDRYRGETVKAFVVPTAGAELTEEQILAHCTEHLAPYKVPRSVELRPSLPRTAVGKPLRRILLDEERAAAASEAPVRARPARTRSAGPARKQAP